MPSTPSTSSTRRGQVKPPRARERRRQSSRELTRGLQADDELDNPYLAGFEWDREESWTRLIVHLQKESGASMTKKKKKSDE